MLEMTAFDRGLEVHHDGDLPARSGMGSSSAFTVGLLHSIYALRGQSASKAQLAREAIHVEQDLIKDTVGAQDQILASFGGFNRVTFLPDDRFEVEPLSVPVVRLQELNASLMLFYTGLRRTASTVAASYVAQIGDRAAQLHRLRQMVDEGARLLTSAAPLAQFGRLLDEAWQLKRSFSHLVSNDQVDQLYAEARRGGALGGKLLGAGGGGFLLFFVPPECQAQVSERLRDLIRVPFQFDTRGTQVIFHSPEQDYSELDQARRHGAVPVGREAFPAAAGAPVPPPTPTCGPAA